MSAPGPRVPPESRFAAVAAIATLAVYAVTMAVVATGRGIGVSPDSTLYLAVAANLRDGLGLVAPWWDGSVVPLSHYPPLFPALLAALSMTGVSLEQAARLVNPLMFGITVALTARAAGGPRRRLGTEAVMAAGLVATSLDLLTVHTMVWSEPLFLAFGLAGFIVLGVSFNSNNRWRIAAAAMLVAAASLVRFPGVALILGGVLVLIARTDRPWLRRLTDAVLFGAIAAGPLVLLFLRNAITTGHAANRPVVIHLLLGWRVRTALIAFASWMTPGASGSLDNAVIVVIGGLALVAIAIAMGRLVARSGGLAVAFADVPTRLACAFIASYLLIATADMIFLDASQYYGDRLITPLFIALVIAICSQLRRGGAGRLPRTALAAAALLMTLGALAQARYTADAHAHGLAYGRDVWRRSPTMAVLRQLPPEIRVVTNRPDAVRYLAKRPAAGVPLRRGIQSYLPNDTYAAELDRLVAVVNAAEGDQLVADVADVTAGHNAAHTAGHTVVVWFTADPPVEGLMVSPQELDALLVPRRELADGVIYGRMPAR